MVPALDARGVRRRRGLPRPGHAPVRAAGRDVPGGARPRARAQPALHRPDAARRAQAQRAGHPDRGRLQPRLHRHRLHHVRRRAARLVGGAARARLHRRPRARLLRRPALDRPRAGDGGRLLRAARSRLQRRLLEPPHAHGRGARRALVRQRRAAQAVPLQRLRRLEAAHALQAPGPHPADRRAGAGEALPAVRRRARGERRRRGLELALQLRHDRLGDPARLAQAPALSRPDGRRLRRVAAAARGRGRVRPRRLRARRARWRVRRHALPGGAVGRPRRPPAALPRPHQPGRRPRLRRVGVHARARRGPDPGVPAAAAARQGAAARRPRAPARSQAAAAGVVAGGQRGRLPQLRARGRGGRAPGHRRARRRRRAVAAGRPDRAREPPGPSLRARRHLARRLPDQPRVRQRGHAPEPRGAARAGVLREPPHDRAVVVGGVGLPRALAQGIRLRRRAVGRLGVRGRDARRGVAQAGRAHADAGHAPAGGRPSARGARPTRRLRVPARLRLRVGARAQEPGRVDRRVPAGVPGPGGGRAAGPQEHQFRAAPERARPGAARGQGPPPRAPARLLRLGRREERDDRVGRLLRVAASLRGLRDHDGRGDAARQAGRRHRVLRQPRLHAARELVPRRLRARADRCWQRPLPARGGVGGARPRPRGEADARGLRGPGGGAAPRRDGRRRHPPLALRGHVRPGHGGASAADPRDAPDRRLRPDRARAQRGGGGAGAGRARARRRPRAAAACAPRPARRSCG